MCARGVVIYSHVHKRRGYIQSCAQEAWLYTVMCTRGVVIYWSSTNLAAKAAQLAGLNHT